MNKKILVTGATGFIGRHLVDALIEQEYQVTCILRKGSTARVLPQSPLLSLEILDLANIEKDRLGNILNGVDVVFYLAGQLGEYGLPYETYHRINCEYMLNMLSICDTFGVKQFIYSSTPGVYGFGKRLCNESTSYAPRNDYERSKVEGERGIIHFCKNFNVSYTIIRPDFVYGPGDLRRIKLYKNIQNKRFILTTSGQNYLHPTYIADVIQGFLISIDKPSALNQIFNIAAMNDITVIDYLSIIANLVNSKIIHINIGYALSTICASTIDSLSRQLLNREGFVSRNKIDFLSLNHSSSIKKAQELLGYKPQFTAQEGLELTIQHLRLMGEI